MESNGKNEKTVLVLQGGGALGAYQAGAYQALAEEGYDPDWLAGISIGAINAAIIAGNPAGARVGKLQAFWERVSSSFTAQPWLPGSAFREIFNKTSAAMAAGFGVPGFFSPRIPPAYLTLRGAPGTASYYDTTPLRKTLLELIDFDLLNTGDVRLSLGAVNVATGNFAYFDTEKTGVGPEHVMASGALPPGFPPVEIDGQWYWDGGLLSNTPLQFVLENSGTEPLCVFQIDLFNARGTVPASLFDVAQREKDIRYSSRTRLTTDRFRQLYDVSAAAARLRERLPEDMQDDADLMKLLNAGPNNAVTLVHLIHRKEEFEGQSKDCEFSRLSMTEHWAAGKSDVRRTLEHKSWLARSKSPAGIQIFDLSGKMRNDPRERRDENR